MAPQDGETSMKTHALWLVVCLVFSAAILAGENPNADWPQFRGPNRNGVSNENEILTAFPSGGPRQIWKFSVGAGFSSVSVSKGRAYTLGNTKNVDSVFCFDAKSGTVLWKQDFPCSGTAWAANAKAYVGTRSTLTLEADHIYYFSLDLKLRCLEAQSGKVVWEIDLEKEAEVEKEACHWGLGGSPLVVGNQVIQHLGAGAAGVDKATGKLAWKWKDTDKDAGGYASPVLFKYNNQDTVAILTKSLVALDPAAGKELWRFPKWQVYDHGLNASDPVIFEDKIFLSQGNYTRNSGMFKITGKTDAHWQSEGKLWSGEVMLNYFGTSVLWQGHLYGFSDLKLRCVEAQTGKVKWDETGLTTKYGNVIVCAGKLVCLTDKGELIVAEGSPDGFKPLARAVIMPAGENAWIAPALAQGLLYARTTAGSVVCVDLKKH